MNERILNCIKFALPKAGKTSLWLLKIILPLSLAVRLLQYSGVLVYVAEYLNPVFSLIGLPGATAIVFITSIFLPLYASVAVMASLSITLREATILALMCLIAHNMIVECAIQKKTGSSFFGMFTLRVAMAFLVAFIMNRVMPASDVLFSVMGQTVVDTNLMQVLQTWLSTSAVLIITILSIVSVLMVLQKILEEYQLLDVISRPLRPMMSFFGMSRNSSFLWIVGNLVGLTYGGAIMVDLVDEGKLTPHDANIVNHHLAISHSLLEDTLIFVALGINLWWIILTRLIFAFIVVWCLRFKEYLGREKKLSSTI